MKWIHLFFAIAMGTAATVVEDPLVRCMNVACAMFAFGSFLLALAAERDQHELAYHRQASAFWFDKYMRETMGDAPRGDAEQGSAPDDLSDTF